jgi:hypothetical protein
MIEEGDPNTAAPTGTTAANPAVEDDPLHSLTTGTTGQTPAPPPPPPFEPPAEEIDFASEGRRATVEAVLNTWGGIYVGEWRADQPHGEGTLQLRNGQIYQGTFARGRIKADT